MKIQNGRRLITIAASLTVAVCVLPTFAKSTDKDSSGDGKTMTENQKADPAAAKNSNVAAARQLNGTTDSKSKKANSDTATAVNQIPGVKVDSKDMQSPDSAPIKGFHPIKKILQPVENLEGMSIKLEQQIMKLEGPIAALQPPMINLQNKMSGVDQSITQMQDRLSGMSNEVTGVRADLAAMHKEIASLKGPILSIQKPLANVSTPLESLQRQLNIVIIAIFVASIAVALGTPIAALLIYRYRDKLFPGKTSADLPKEAALR